jgi:hypothetical protein
MFNEALAINDALSDAFGAYQRLAHFWFHFVSHVNGTKNGFALVRPIFITNINTFLIKIYFS